MATKAAVKFNFADFLKAMMVLSQILPAVNAFIKSMEAEQLSGPEKKAAVLAFVQSLLTGAGAYVSELSPELVLVVMQFADPLIDACVSAFNAVKLFVHKVA